MLTIFVVIAGLIRRVPGSGRAPARLLATVFFLAPLALACGRKEEQPPVATPRAPSTPGVAATEAPAVASPAATTTTPPQPGGTAAPAVSATPRPPATSPRAPVATPATQPEAPPPPAAAISAPPPATPAERPAATQPAAPGPAAQGPKGTITLPAKLGAVTFDHGKHAGTPGVACTTCHHPSRPPKPQALENQACRHCHTMPAAAPMKTSLQAAFHDPKGAAGTCIDCHKQQKIGAAPLKCLECHKKK